jgi:hypothetical protein
MRTREVTLKRRGLDDVDRQNAEQDRMSAERFLVLAENDAAGARDFLGDFGRVSSEFLDAAVCRLKTLRGGLGLRRLPGSVDDGVYSKADIGLIRRAVVSSGVVGECA